MAVVKENDLTEGLSGRFGRKIVFRVVRGVTVAARRSTKKKVLSEKQIAQVDRFQRATQYAKEKMLDPVAKKEYRQMAGDNAFSNSFAAAVRDYLIAPKVLEIKVSQFTGIAGSTILVQVSDNVKTIRIKVTVADSDTSVIESGYASYTPGDVEWKYITTQALPSLTGVKIVVTAVDRPGNETTYEKVLI